MKKILSLVLALCMALCMVSFASAEEVPTLKIITLGNGQPDNYSAWIEHLNPYHRREDRRQTWMWNASAGATGATAAASSSTPTSPMTSSSATAATWLHDVSAGRVSGHHRPAG